MGAHGHDNKADMGRILGGLWNEYLDSIPTSRPGRIVIDEEGIVQNVVSVERFFGYLGNKASEKEIKDEQL